MKGQVVDNATGAVLYGIDSIVTGHIDARLLPGRERARRTANVKLDLERGVRVRRRHARASRSEFSGASAITVGDDADILKVEGTAQGSEDAEGRRLRPVVARPTAATRTAGDNIANDGERPAVVGCAHRAIALGGEGATHRPAGRVLSGSMSVFVETMVMAAAKEAEKLWKSRQVPRADRRSDGRRRRRRTRSRTSSPRSSTGSRATSSTSRSTATLERRASPSSRPARSSPRRRPSSYTAGPEEGDVGRIAFKSVSNRGIAETT